MSKLRNVLALTAVAVLALMAACSKQAAPPEPERAVRTIKVSDGSAGLQLEYAAEVRARLESRLSFRVGGKLLSRRVNLGDVVSRGQVLAQLDSQDLQLAQEAAHAGVAAARANRDQLGADLKRFIELRNQGFISAAELDRRETQFKSAQAQLDQARAQADVQGNQAAYATLYADAPGVVTGVMADPGIVVNAGTPIVQVAQDGARDIVFSVPEDKVALTRAASALPGALKLRMWGGDQGTQNLTLREVSAAADPATRTFQFKADAGKIDVKLGQTATVLLDLPKTDNAIKVPLTAVLEQQGKSVVWLLDAAKMTVRPQPVVVSGADGNDVVIAGGLKPGDEVVTAGVHVLTPGEKVKRYIAPTDSNAATPVMQVPNSPIPVPMPAPAPVAAAASARPAIVAASH